MVNGVWVTDRDTIKYKAICFFDDKFKEPYVVRPPFHNQNLKGLSSDNNTILENEFTLEEIKDAIWDCGGGKALELGEFTFKFIKRY